MNINQYVIDAQANTRNKALALFSAGDKVIITCSNIVNNAKYLNIVGEYEFTCHDGMAYVLVKAKGQRVARSICVNPLTMLVKA